MILAPYSAQADSRDFIINMSQTYAGYSNLLESLTISERRTEASSITLPRIIARRILDEYGITQVDPVNVQCLGVVHEILDYYENCIDRGDNPAGCANTAAWQIKNNACRSYCDCR